MKILTIVLLLALALLPSALCRIRHYKWNLQYNYKSPDCFRKLVITINGASPGPTIYAKRGDLVVVDVTNSLVTENLAIHWHGIRQKGTPWSDGAAGITQCPIQPGDTFTYKFTVDHAGTFIYHAHYGMQRAAGLFGSLIVSLPDGEKEPYSYDYDRSIVLNDWYHKSTYEQATGLSSIPFGWVGEPQSLLIQGRGKFNCSGLDPATCNVTNPECSLFTTTVVPGKTYRLRVTSMASLSSLSFQIEGHNLTVVESDGYNVEPFTVNKLFIYSGETYSVLLKADQDPSRNYWMATDVVSRKPTTPQGIAILNYYPNWRMKSPPNGPPPGPQWDDKAPRIRQSVTIKARSGYEEKPPVKADKVIVLLNTQNKLDGHMRWSLNNVTFDIPKTPYLISLKYNLSKQFTEAPPPEGYDAVNYDIWSPPPNPNVTASDGIYKIKLNSTVDIVLQNANTLTVNNSETHPWHLHGHDFWVLGYGEGKFDAQKDPLSYNLDNPIQKNTVPVHPYGWTAIRYRADNPGVWFFHCHVEAHLHMGMGIVLEEGAEQVGRLPKSIMGCGSSKTLTALLT